MSKLRCINQLKDPDFELAMCIIMAINDSDEKLADVELVTAHLNQK